jgi:hypothetical protein
MMMDADFFEEHGQHDGYFMVTLQESSPTCQTSYSPSRQGEASPPAIGYCISRGGPRGRGARRVPERRSQIMQGKAENDTGRQDALDDGRDGHQRRQDIVMHVDGGGGVREGRE